MGDMVFVGGDSTKVAIGKTVIGKSVIGKLGNFLPVTGGLIGMFLPGIVGRMNASATLFFEK